jgi:hypothetical protein
MQKFTTIQETDKVRDSREPLLENDQTVLSNSAGNSFPTSNLLRGMFCVRTDQGAKGRLYQLVSVSPVEWKLVADLEKTALHKEEAEALFVALTGATMSGDVKVHKSDAGVEVGQDGNNYTRMQRDSSGQYTIKHYVGGTLRATIQIDSSGTLKVDGNKVWHAGNDGPASGLDADTLDGVQASSLLLASAITNGTLAPTLASLTVNGNTTVKGSLSLNDAETLYFGLGTPGQSRIHNDGSDNLLIEHWGGGALKGTLQITAAGALRYNGQTIWHAGNTGAGSGLDADKWDGGHKTFSTGDPSGGSDGDVWFKYT